MAEQLYCLKNKQFSDAENIEIKETKNGRKYLSGICRLCNKKHSKFLKGDGEKQNKKSLVNNENKKQRGRPRKNAINQEEIKNIQNIQTTV